MFPTTVVIYDSKGTIYFQVNIVIDKNDLKSWLYGGLRQKYTSLGAPYDVYFKVMTLSFPEVVWATFRVGHHPKSCLRRLGTQDF